MRSPGEAFGTEQRPALRPISAKGSEEMALGVEDLDAVVVSVGDVEPASLVDHDAAGLSELAGLTPFLAEAYNGSIGTCFNIGQEGAGDQEDKGDQTAKKPNDTSTTGASHGLIHHRES